MLRQFSTLDPCLKAGIFGTQQVVNNQTQKGYIRQKQTDAKHSSTAALDDVKQVTYNKLSSRITLAVKCILRTF
jgi:hypothetical protein